MSYLPLTTLAVGLLWTVAGFIKNDFNSTVGAQPWITTCILLSYLIAQ